MAEYKELTEYTEEEQALIYEIMIPENFDKNQSTEESCGLHKRYPLIVFVNETNKVSIETNYTELQNSRECFKNNGSLYKLENI